MHLSVLRCILVVFGNACLDLFWRDGKCAELLRRSCARWELFRVVGAMFGVALLDPFSLIGALECLESFP